MSSFVIKMPSGFHGGDYGAKGLYEYTSLENANVFEDFESAKARVKYLEHKGYTDCEIINKESL